MVKKTILKMMFVAGVALLILAPILGYTIDRVEKYNRKPVTIDEYSSDGL